MTTSPRYGIIFPGQGAQSVGMLADIAACYPVVQQTFEAASQVLGYDLWQLTQQGPRDKLNQTLYTQPAILTSSYAIWRILNTQGLLHAITRVAGHSLGEYTALVCAEACSFEEAVRLVQYRAQWMQEVVPTGEGAMAAIIGMNEEAVRLLCQTVTALQSNWMVSPANFNTPEQIVIAGHHAAVSYAMDVAKKQGAQTILLPVSVPSHCLLMQSAAQRLQQLLSTITFKTPVLPVVKNIDATCYDGGATIADSLTKQLYSPVRWVETMQRYEEAGTTTLIECGPGKILAGLMKRMKRSMTVITTFNLSHLKETLQHVDALSTK